MGWQPKGTIKGPTGATGPTGLPGVSAQTLTTANFDVPALGSTVVVSVQDTSWATVGEFVWVAGGAGGGNALAMQITAKTSTTLTLLNPTIAPGASLPSGGIANQALVKNTATDFDASWKSAVLPVGGSIAQVLSKNSAADYDANWGTVAAAQGGLPTGGAASQVLTKNSATNYDASWILPALQVVAFAPTGPAGTTNTTGVMMGMGATARFTPSKTGKFIVFLNCTSICTVAYGGIQGGICVGTGTAPANGVAVVGSQGILFTTQVPAANSYTHTPTIALISGSVGTNYWIDAYIRNFGVAGTSQIVNPYFVIVEI